VAELQNTSPQADSDRVNRPAVILEPIGDDAGVEQVRVRDLRRRPPTPRISAGPAAPQARPAELRANAGQQAVQVVDFERIEDYLRAYLDGERFASVHPLARGRWLIAWEMLWCADSRIKVIGLGRRAHDALGAFSESLLERCLAPAADRRPEAPSGDTQPAEPLDGLATVAEAYRAQLGDDRCELLTGLLEHWRALAAAVTRHETAADRGSAGELGQRLRWEDGRRLVLFTALVMVEIDRSFA
jgi:hypothetical protein